VRLYFIAVLITTKFSAIQQFKDGVDSISVNILHASNYELVCKYLQKGNVVYTFEEIINLFEYGQMSKVESGPNI